jgi:hypothetical protein
MPNKVKVNEKIPYTEHFFFSQSIWFECLNGVAIKIILNQIKEQQWNS